MTINVNRLPPLNSFIVFEASARHLSFTKAATELHLTQAAVSKQISQLEERLRVTLFKRGNRSVTLTPQGHSLYQTVYKSLGEIAATVAAIKSPGAALVTLACSAAFATLWLVPRLHRFGIDHPDIALRLVATERNLGPLPETVDLSVRYGNRVNADSGAGLLFPVDIAPVCSPEFQTRHALADIRQLAGLPLLELTTDHWQGMDWESWLKNSSSPLTDLNIQYFFNDYVMLQRAAEHGLGVGLAWSHLCDDGIQQGKLVFPFGEKVGPDPGWGYYLQATHPTMLSPESRRVMQWLETQAKTKSTTP